MTQYRSQAFELTRKYTKVCTSDVERHLNRNSDIKHVSLYSRYIICKKQNEKTVYFSL